MGFPVTEIYAAVGDTCFYTPANGVEQAQPIFVALDVRPGDALSGEQVSTRYELRGPAASFGGQIARGARFRVKGLTYEATAKGQPFNAGDELAVPVKVVL